MANSRMPATTKNPSAEIWARLMFLMLSEMDMPEALCLCWDVGFKIFTFWMGLFSFMFLFFGL